MSALSPPQEEVVVAAAPKRKRRRSVLGRPPQTLGELLAFRIEQVERQMVENRQEVRALFVRVDAKFDKVDAKFDKVDEKFDKVDAKIDKVDAKIDNVDAKIGKTSSDMMSRLSWQTGFIGVMIVILSLVIAVVSWRQSDDRSSLRQEDNPRNRTESPARIEQRDTPTP